MELKKIRKTSKELELEVIGENETMLNPITEILLKNKNVDYASYITDHPESNKLRLYELKEFEKNFSGKRNVKVKSKSEKKTKKTTSKSKNKRR